MSEPVRSLQSALVVPVPEAEALVGEWRLEHDTNAANGVPAHVTLLFPFRAPDRVDATLDELRALFRSVERRPFRLTHIGVFPGVVWLAPEPSAPFVDLTDRLVERFPDCKPYGGAFRQVVPHLTVIDHSRREDAPGTVRDAFIVQADPSLPIDAELAEAILLVEDDDGHWSTHTRFPLG